MKLYAALGVVVLLAAIGVVTYAAGDGNADQAATVTLETRTAADDEVAPAEDAVALVVAVPAPTESDGPPDQATGPDSAAPSTTTPSSTESDPAIASTVESTDAPDGEDESESAAPSTSIAPASPIASTAPDESPAAESVHASAEVLEPLRNAKPEFSRYRDVPSVDLPMGSLTTGGAGAPTPNPISGQFRMHCEYSHFAYDDPIVYPGEAGRSHLHMFFGNTDTDAFSTSDSLFDQGGGSCNGYELDRSAYWIPALMSGTTQTIVPREILLYFKTHSPDSVQTFPKGLRVIAGASPSDPDGATRYRWKCEGSTSRPAGTFEPINDGPFYETIPDCRALGFETLGYILDFPFCWDGKNLDSEDHRSHMSYGCSASHPVVFPQLQYVIHYVAPPSNVGLHLSSDPLDCQTGASTACGHTLHGDWWNAWHEQTNATWISECSRKRVVCQVPAVSATTNLVGPGVFDGNPVLQMPENSYIPGRH